MKLYGNYCIDIIINHWNLWLTIVHLNSSILYNSTIVCSVTYCHYFLLILSNSSIDHDDLVIDLAKQIETHSSEVTRNEFTFNTMPKIRFKEIH